MLNGIHILLTYGCTFECDHCFLYCGPWSRGTFTRRQLSRVLDEASAMGGVEWIYFEGGEPFLYYGLMVEGLRMARDKGFTTGVVTNCYWATSEEDARVWLRPLADLGLADLSISDDWFHGGDSDETPARAALRAATAMGLPVHPIRIERPASQGGTGTGGRKGAAIVGGRVKFRGRAADKLTHDQARKPAGEFDECPFEDLERPGRVHVDAFGNVHFCQGLCIGSMWERPLAGLLEEYRAPSHPILGPLVEGGPARLAEVHGVTPDKEGYVDACHFCYLVRRRLVDRFPGYLTPRSIYGPG